MALFDVCFILISVPESLPEQVRPKTWGSPISWDQVDPFSVSIRLNHQHCTSVTWLTGVIAWLAMSSFSHFGGESGKAVLEILLVALLV